MHSPRRLAGAVQNDTTATWDACVRSHTMTTTPERARVTDATTRTDPTDDPVVASTSDGAPVPLELLDDEYARSILRVLGDGPKRGRDLIDACDASRPTVYRRLDSLETAGLVRSETTLDPDGHHCKEFELARDTLAVTVEDGAVTVTARPS